MSQKELQTKHPIQHLQQKLREHKQYGQSDEGARAASNKNHSENRCPESFVPGDQLRIGIKM